MSQIIKAYTGIFLLLILMMASAGMLGVYTQTLHAQNSHALMIDELENSDYAKPVLESLYEFAKKHHYGLTVILYRENETEIICQEAGQIPENMADIFMAEVRLSYEVRVPFFGIVFLQELQGYGR